MPRVSKKPSLLKFPCDFPIKIIGHQTPEFQATALKILRHHFPRLAEETIKMNPSKEGKYLALTATVRATSQKKLDELYRELSSTKEIIMAL